MDNCLRCSGELFIIPATDNKRVFLVNREINIGLDIFVCKNCGYTEFVMQQKYLDKMKEIHS